MRLSFAILSVFCFALLAQAAPAPRLVDEHETRMKIAVMRPEAHNLDDAAKHAEVFRIKVIREDDLYDTEQDDAVVGRRLKEMSVDIKVEDDAVIVDGQRVPVGVHRLKARAFSIAAVRKPSKEDHKEMTEKERSVAAKETAKHFDAGLVGMAIGVKAEAITRDGVEARRIILQEIIYEMDGKKLSETVAQQQMLEFMPDGHVHRQISDCGAADMMDGLQALAAGDARDVNAARADWPTQEEIMAWYEEYQETINTIAIVIGALFGFLVTILLCQLYLAHRLRKLQAYENAQKSGLLEQKSAAWNQVSGYLPVAPEEETDEEDNLPLYREKA